MGSSPVAEFRTSEELFIRIKTNNTMESIVKTNNHKEMKKTGESIACFFSLMIFLIFINSGCNKEDYSIRLVYPELATTAASGITSVSASSGGNITSEGGSDITARGICWGTAMNPSLIGSFTTDGSGSGQFTSTITGLLPGTLYHVRAYATNTQGTAYGLDVTFTTATN